MATTMPRQESRVHRRSVSMLSLLVLFGSLLCSHATSVWKKVEQRKNIESWVYSKTYENSYPGEVTNYIQFPGFGFDVGGSASIEITAGYMEPSRSGLSVFTTVDLSTIIPRTLFYLDVCEYTVFDLANKEIYERTSGRTPQSICRTLWYRTFAGGRCFSVPLAMTVLDPYRAYASFNATTSVVGYYTFLFFNCELSSAKVFERSCSAVHGAPADSFSLSPNNDGSNCSDYAEDGSKSLQYKYTFAFRNPGGFLSNTELPYITIYFVWTVVWGIMVIVWLLNTFRFRNTSGIILQWHLAMVIVLKLASVVVNWEYYRIKNMGGELNPIVNVSLNILFDCALYESLIRISNGWMITVRALPRWDLLRVVSPVVVYMAGNMVYQIFYDSQFPVYDPGEQKVDVAIIVIALGANGGAYFFILITVWSSTVRWAKHFEHRLDIMRQLGMNTVGTVEYHKMKMFSYFRLVFLAWLTLIVITWFGVNTAQGRTGNVYFPWVPKVVTDSLEFVFLSGVLWTFRARKFNIIQQDLNTVMAATSGAAVHPTEDAVENTADAPSNMNRDASDDRSNNHVVIMNPHEGESSVSLGKRFDAFTGNVGGGKQNDDNT